MRQVRGGPAPPGGVILGRDGAGVVALPAPRGGFGVASAYPGRRLAEPFDPARDRSRWHAIRRAVGLSGLGWGFVLVAVFWERFAVIFGRCAGCTWEQGAFFFAWGLGTLAYGLYLRTDRQRSAVSRLFLGVNVLVVGVLSLVVANR
jgi:hypothetical protein